MTRKWQRGGRRSATRIRHAGHVSPVHVLTLLAWVMLVAVQPVCARTGPTEAADCVVLIHGLGRTQLSMKAIEWALVDNGFEVVNEGYPSLSRGLEDLAGIAVPGGIERCRSLGANRIHFVTHSLGGILVRLYLSGTTLPDLGRVVMLAPPNQGSQLAEYVDGFALLRDFLPPVIHELNPDASTILARLGPVDFQLGVIAGSRNRRPFTPGAPDGPSDGTVAVAETRVRGMDDFITLPVTHTFMAWDAEVIRQMLAFLQLGHFDRPPDID